MLVFLKHVAESVAEQGVQGLIAEVPGGKFAYGVAEGVLKKYRERKREAQLRADLMEVAQAAGERVAADAVEAVRAAFAAVPAGAAGPPASDGDIVTLELYLSAVPDAVRASLRRREDPTGRTVPADFAARSADDVLRLLPTRAPRFRPGADLPGMPGWGLEKLLGTGGFGEVWLARHRRMASLHGAVKFCLDQTGRDLIREADLIDRVMAAGRHPNIVALTNAHLDGDTPWLMFEYVPGGSLTEWVHRLAALPPAERVAQATDALKQLAGAVAFFHALTLPVVHRDLKPSNVLFDPATNKLRITDFGIGAVTAREALRQEPANQSTRGGRLQTYLRGAHTPLYASPQQRDGSDADPRDDVHALGVIGYQMLTGHLTLGAGPDFADDLRESGVGEGLISTLGHCVAGRLERRLANAAEVVQQIEFSTDRVDHLRHLATTGDTAAMLDLGHTYEYRFDDQDEALRWYRMGADMDNSACMNALGHMYSDRLLQWDKRDVAESFRWHKRAADAGYVGSMKSVRSMYELGEGTHKDLAEAARWCRRAAEAGDVESMVDFAGMCEYGRGVKMDDNEAIHWYKLAAAADNEFAIKKLQQGTYSGRSWWPSLFRRR